MVTRHAAKAALAALAATTTAWPKRPTYTGRAPSTSVPLETQRPWGHETLMEQLSNTSIYPFIMISSFIQLLADICWNIFPQQRKLVGSSAQNSSGVHLCRRLVRFNEVPEKVPKVPEKVWEALVQSQVRFNGVPEKVPEKVWGGFGAEPGQVQ